jgi:hypothetical protein
MAFPQDSAAPVAPQSPSVAPPRAVAPSNASPTVAPREALPDVCPYCGERTERVTSSEQTAGTPRCRACLAFLDPLSKHVTQGQMGPWFQRDTTRPFYPGLAFEVLTVLIARGEITRETVLRGPGSGQFWMAAGRTPGVAHLLGVCHGCGAETSRSARSCASCGAAFPIFAERDRLGLTRPEAPTRVSAFASDEELRAGAAPPRADLPRPMPIALAQPATAASGGLIEARRREDDGPSPLEITLSEEVVAERRKTLWLMLGIGLLLVVNMIVAIWAMTRIG